MQKESLESKPLNNIDVMCRCGLVFATAIDIKKEDGFCCPNCRLPISSPLLT